MSGAGGREPPLIAHVIYRLDYGGLENGLVNLIHALPPERYRHAVVCLTGYMDFRERLPESVPVLALRKAEGNDLALYPRLWRTFRRLAPTIVHTRNLAALEAQPVARLAGVPIRIHGEHGRDVHDLDNRSRRYRRLRRAMRPFVHRYVPLSRELERYLVDEVRVPAGRVRRICNGVDSARFAPREGARRWLDAAPFDASGRVVIGSVGRMEAVKDPLNLARAFAHLVASTPDGRDRLALVMLGDGALLTDVRDFLEAAGVADIVWLPGARDDVAEAMAAFDVFALPSLAEGISNTVLEAMASGLPVVATDVGGNAELVVAGETGALVPRADPQALAAALATYVADPALRAAHGAAGRARVLAEFSLDRMVARYAALYDELLNERVPQAALGQAAGGG